ncbi:MAG: hypothetical protein ACFFKA_06890 [Candidatus Thorarchaeota archaeon]
MASQKKTSLYSIILLGIIAFSLFSYVNAQGEEPLYKVGFDAGTELVWEVTELDAYSFQTIFGFEPNFEIGDQIRIVVKNVREFTATFIIDYEFWDYKTDWGATGEDFSLIMYKNTTTYEDYLYSLTPVDDYLAAVVENLPSEYTALGSTIIKRAISDEGKEYRWDKEYDIRGIPVVETYFDEFNQVLVRVEGTFRISFGFYFIGFMVLGMLGVMSLVIVRKRYRVKQ